MILSPLLIALDAAIVLILAVLIAEFAQMRRRPVRMALPVVAMPHDDFRRPPEWGPIAVPRDTIDRIREAIMEHQLIMVGDKRHSRWTDDEKRLYVRHWRYHEDDYVHSIAGRGIA